MKKLWGVRHVRWAYLVICHKFRFGAYADHPNDELCKLYMRDVRRGAA